MCLLKPEEDEILINILDWSATDHRSKGCLHLFQHSGDYKQPLTFFQLFSSCAMVHSEDEYFEEYYMQRKTMHYFSSTTVSPISTVICLILFQIYTDFKEFMILVMLQYSRETSSMMA